MRNIKKQAEIGSNLVEQNHRLDLSAEEVRELLRLYQSDEGIIKAISTAYYSGLAVGYRNGQKHQ